MASLKISLRAGERLFLNGAVLRVDRKTQIELLNDVTSSAIPSVRHPFFSHNAPIAKGPAISGRAF